MLTFHSLFIRRDGGTLDAHTVFLDGLGGVDGHLVIGSVTVGQSEIIVQALHIKVGKDQLKSTNYIRPGLKK